MCNIKMTKCYKEIVRKIVGWFQSSVAKDCQLVQYQMKIATTLKYYQSFAKLKL